MKNWGELNSYTFFFGEKNRKKLVDKETISFLHLALVSPFFLLSHISKRECIPELLCNPLPPSAFTNSHHISLINWFYSHHLGLKLSLIIIIVGSTVLSIYHKQIVTAFEPKKSLITSYPGSWAVPIGLLILVSFPPLFGHEVIILVVGLIWGLGIGFAIAATGTFLGEMLCFIAFKYYFIERAKKIEDESLLYGALARLMREGGLGMLVLVRFSVLPG